MEHCLDEKQEECEVPTTCELDCEPDDQKVKDYMLEQTGEMLDSVTARKLQEDAVGIALKESMEACNDAGRSGAECITEATETARKVRGKKSGTAVDAAE